MVKIDSISNDLNLVKEFEELKLKQKLLIEALNSKSKTEMNQFLLDINAKLDFLVKIFKESQKVDEEETTEDEIKKSIDSVLEKFDLVDKKIDEKFDLMENKFEDLNKKILKTEGIVERNLNHPSSSIPTPSFEIDSKLKEDKIKENGPTTQIDNKNNTNNNNNYPVTSESKVNNIPIVEKEKKKRKWF